MARIKVLRRQRAAQGVQMRAVGGIALRQMRRQRPAVDAGEASLAADALHPCPEGLLHVPAPFGRLIGGPEHGDAADTGRGIDLRGLFQIGVGPVQQPGQLFLGIVFG